jgi:predicted Fe-Mo cluster-binding NifX family protein
VTIPANGKEKEKKVKNETGTTIRFTKYEVNTGKAQRYINDGIKR